MQNTKSWSISKNVRTQTHWSPGCLITAVRNHQIRRRSSVFSTENSPLMTTTDCLPVLPPWGMTLSRYILHCSHSHPLDPSPVGLRYIQIPRNTCIFFPRLLPNTQNTSIHSIWWDQSIQGFLFKNKLRGTGHWVNGPHLKDIQIPTALQIFLPCINR